MADLNITAEFSDLQLLKRELIDIPKKARDSASVFEREYKRVERQIQKSAVAHQRYYKEVQQANLANKSAAQSASIFSQALAKQESRIDTLRAKYNPLYAASKQYERALEEINEANRIGALNDAQREASLEQLHKEYANGTGQFARYTAMASGRVNQMGVVTQQAGYQIGDFLVQVQSGTNAFVAFGQQATQLVGILPLMGAGFMGLSQMALVGLSAGLGIAIPLVTALGAAFLRTRNEADATGGRFTTVEQAIDSLKEKADEAALSMRLLSEGIANVEQARILDEIAQKERELLDLRERLETQSGRNARATQLRINNIEAEIISLQERSQEYQNTIEQKERMDETLRFIEDTGVTSVTAQVQILTTALGLSADEAKRLVDNLNLAMTMTPSVPFYMDGQSLLPPSPEDTGTGGGGGAVQDGVGGVARSLLTDVERLQLEFEERRAAIEEFNAIEIELFGSKNEAIERLEAEHQAKMQEIRNQERSARLSDMSSLFGSLASIAQTGGGKLVKIQATFSAISSTIAAYENAITAAAKAPTPLAKAAIYAKFLAQGLGAVAKIKQAGGIGGGGGGAGGADVAAPVAAAAPEPQQVIIEGIDRDSLISGEQLSKLFDRLYEENDERGIVFSVAR